MIDLQCPPSFQAYVQRILSGEYNHPAQVIRQIVANAGSFAIWA
jgi:hypothetical protein